MAHWSTLNSYFTVVKSILTKITVSIGPSFKDSCTAHAIPACQQLCYHAQVSYWSFLLHCLALFLLQAASSAKQALSQLQHRASWDSTITALHGLLCAVFLPQLGASAPVSVSPDMGGSSSLLGSPRGSWVQQTQREGSFYHHVQRGAQQTNVTHRDVWPPTNSEGWVCFDTFPGLRNPCNLPKQEETNAAHLSICLCHLILLHIFVALGSKTKQKKA